MRQAIQLPEERINLGKSSYLAYLKEEMKKNNKVYVKPTVQLGFTSFNKKHQSESKRWFQTGLFA